MQGKQENEIQHISAYTQRNYGMQEQSIGKQYGLQLHDTLAGKRDIHSRHENPH